MLLVVKLSRAAVRQEILQERHHLLSVHAHDLEDPLVLGRLGDKNLEDMERLILDHATVVAQEVHCAFEVFRIISVLHHEVVVHAVEEDVGQKLDGQALDDVIVAADQEGVVAVKEHFLVDIEEVGNEPFVLGEKHLSEVVVSKQA